MKKLFITAAFSIVLSGVCLAAGELAQFNNLMKQVNETKTKLDGIQLSMDNPVSGKFTDEQKSDPNGDYFKLLTEYGKYGEILEEQVQAVSDYYQKNKTAIDTERENAKEKGQPININERPRGH